MNQKTIKQQIVCRAERADDLDGVAGKLFEAHPEARVFAFFGAMGVGKTTFIKSLCRLLGATDRVSSPSFAIVNECFTENGDSIYHFDFYRIKKLEEVYDLGYEHYFYSGNYCFIEWPGKLDDLLPEDCIRVDMHEENGERVIRF